MRTYAIRLSTILLFVAAGATQAQEKSLDLSKIGDSKEWKVSNAKAERIEAEGKKAVRLKADGDSSQRIAGLAIAKDSAFEAGTIEIDLKGRNLKQQSFLGVAFNIADPKTFEAIYFRPFNFKADAPFGKRAVQYIAWPENTWEKLRQEKPGVFENAVNPIPDPDGWFHARIEVAEKQVKVFVNDAKEPCLTVERLAKPAARPLGLFVDVEQGLYANFKYKPGK